MKKFEITWSETISYSGFVEARTWREAQTAFFSGTSKPTDISITAKDGPSIDEIYELNEEGGRVDTRW